MRDIYSISSLLGIRSEVMYFDGPLRITKGSTIIYTLSATYIFTYQFFQRWQTLFGPITRNITTTLTTY